MQVTALLLIGEVKRHQNTISSVSGHQISAQTVQGITSY